MFHRQKFSVFGRLQTFLTDIILQAYFANFPFFWVNQQFLVNSDIKVPLKAKIFQNASMDVHGKCQQLSKSAKTCPLLSKDDIFLPVVGTWFSTVCMFLIFTKKIERQLKWSNFVNTLIFIFKLTLITFF